MAAAPLRLTASTPPVRPVGHPLLLAITIVIVLVVLAPILTIAGIASAGSGDAWPHLIENVLPRSVRTTLVLMALVGLLTASMGTVSAWLVMAFDFPLRRILAWALVLPLAIPTYLAAYAFGEFFNFTGPVQTAIRALFGFSSSRDYWFPEIRSTMGAAVVLSAVLYPYVYLTCRVVFIMQGRNLADVARTLGATPMRVFFRVLLPVARPAIAAGVALALMETLNDIGAVEYLGVRTLTFAVYATWLNRGSIEGAAQIALVMLALVFALLVAEQWARRRQRYHQGRATELKSPPLRRKLSGWRAALAFLLTLMPVAFGFAIPLQVLGGYALKRMDQFFEPALLKALANSVLTASAAAVIAVAAVLVLLNAARLSRTRLQSALTRFSVLGYALPGTILGFGLLYALAAIDRHIDALARALTGMSTGLVFSGTVMAVILACSIRFLALADGAIRSGLDKLPPNLDEAARSLGRTPAGSASSVLLPLLRPAIFTAAILVFVDTVKELSATIVLRPFGFNTLATHVYENASRGVVQDGAVAALLIIATALVPVIVLSRALMRDRAE
ncbi:MAG: iron ABC transporter permease [Rhizobiaceae bacterium]